MSILRTTLMVVIFLLSLKAGNAQAENFTSLQNSIKKNGFTYAGTVNGFEMHKKGDISLMVRNCGGYLCEGMIVAKPVSNEILAENLIILYGCLQNTFLNHPKSKTKWVEPDQWRTKTYSLIDNVMRNLQTANRTEFAFDNINVRGQCDPVPEKDFRSGKRPVLIIKLWIPKI